MILKVMKNATVQNLASIARTMRYIKDEAKCISPKTVEELAKDRDLIGNLFDNISNDNTIKRSMIYAANKDKTEMKYISGYLCDPETAYEEFVANMDKVIEATRGKLEGNLTYHLVQSFPDELEISDEEVHQCAVEFAQEVREYQMLISSHVHPEEKKDGEIHGKCKHSHFVMSAYKHFDTLDLAHNKQVKFNKCDDTIEALRDLNDMIALRHGLPIIIDPSREKSYNAYDRKLMSDPNSWKRKVKDDVDEAKRNCKNFERFKKYLIDKEYAIREGKYTTLTTSDGNKVRLETLGSEYSAEHLKDYFETKKVIKFRKKKIENGEKLNYRTDKLDNVIARYGSDIFVGLDIERKDKRGRYKMVFDLNTHKHEEIFKRWIDKDKAYELLINKEGSYVTVGAVTGEDLHAYYLVQKDEYKPYLEAIKEEEKSRFTPKYIYIYNYRKKKEYRYDPFYNLENKSNLELMLILAMILLGKIDLHATEPAYPKRVYVYRNFKYQRILDTIDLGNKLNIHSREQLNKEIKSCGQKIGYINREIKAYERTLDNMQDIRDAIDYLNSFGSVGNDNIEERKECKALLYRAGLMNKNKQTDFIVRYDDILAKKIAAENELEKANDNYKKLKRIERASIQAQKDIEANQVRVNLNRPSIDNRLKDIEPERSNSTRYQRERDVSDNFR